MIKAISDELPSLPCTAHTQLMVHEGLLSQRSVAEVLAVGHFKDFALANSRLEVIQLELNQSAKRLQQDVQTRSNSIFYMVQSLIAQKWTKNICV